MNCICEWPDGCDGTGTLYCDGCGGDTCVCDCGGEIYCDGCDECLLDEDESEDYEDDQPTLFANPRRD